MKKFLRIPLFSIALVILFAFQKSNSATAPTPNWLDGQWKGVKYQVNADRAWQTELNVESAKNVYSISYPELGCVGTLELQSATDHQAIFIEKLGDGSCMNDGYIIITKVSDRHISFTCMRDQRQRLASFSTLEKLGKDPS